MIKGNKFDEISRQNNDISKYYKVNENGYYVYQKNTTEKEEKQLRDYFQSVNFTALNFTDSRASYQFYNLEYLWNHIKKAMENNIKVLNIATEPITVSELYKYIKNENFTNEILENVPNYNFKTKYEKLFDGRNGYIISKENVLKDIKKFVEA